MENIRSIHLTRLHGQLSDIVYQLTKTSYFKCDAEPNWRPAINAYHCQDCVTICVDLAGVDKSEIDLQVEPRRLLLQGRRQSPEPQHSENKTLRILAMEIDSGMFRREITFDFEIDPSETTAEQRNGLLWIRLPLRSHS